MSIYQSMPLEEFDGSVASRFDRDYENMADVDTAGIPDARKGRQLDNQSVERQGRLYVDPETLVSETGQDAELEVDEYGLTKIGVDTFLRPEGSVDTNQEAIDARLVPDIGQHIEGYEAPEDSNPSDPDEEE